MAEPPAGEGKRARPGGRFVVEAVLVASARVLSRLATFLAGIAIARILGAEGRGLVATLTVPAALATHLSELGIRQAAAYHAGQSRYPTGILLGTLAALVPLSSLLALALAFLYFELAGIAANDWTLRLLAVAVIPFHNGVSFAGGVLLGRRRIAAFSRVNWVPPLVNLAMILVLAGGLGWNLHGVLAAALIGGIIGAAQAIRHARREQEGPLGFSTALLVDLQKLGLNYALSTFVLLLNFKVMILLLGVLAPLEQAGLFATAASIAEILWEIPLMVSALLFSRSVSAEDPDGYSRKLMSFGRLAVLGACAAAFGLAIVAPFLFPLVFGANFAPSARICILLLPGTVAFVHFRTLLIDIQGRRVPHLTLLLTVPMLLLNLALGYGLIRLGGAEGAAMAASATYILAAGAMIVLYARITGFSLGEIVVPRRADLDLLIANLRAWRARGR